MIFGSFVLDSKGARLGKLISILVISILAVGATIFFQGVFEKLLALEGIGEPLLRRVLKITILTIFWLVVVSNLISGIATLYRAQEIEFLLSRPVSFGRVFLSCFINNLVYSSWSLAILGIPIVVACCLVFGLTVWVILCIITFGLIPLVLIAAEIGTVILSAMIYFARLTSARAAVLLLTIATLAIIGWWVNSQRQMGLIVDGVARTSTVERYLARLNQPGTENLTPAHWFADMLRSLQSRDSRKAVFLAGLLTLTAIVWLRWTFLIADKCYYHCWTSFKELSGRGVRGSSGSSARRFTRGLLPNPLNAMLLKDLLQFVRNPNQWAQFVILVAFLLIYLFNLIYVSSRFDFDNPYWKSIILFLNFAFSGFLLATLSVRFVFPLISLEGRGFWAVRTAPVSIRELFWEKFFLAFVVFMGLCELMIYFSNHTLHFNRVMMSLTTAGMFMMGATLTALGIGMGALMPDFKDESPMRIASTHGGVLTVVINLAYVGLMVAIIARPIYGYFIYLTGQGLFPTDQTFKAFILVIGLNILTVVIPLRSGQKAIEARDF